MMMTPQQKLRAGLKSLTALTADQWLRASDSIISRNSQIRVVNDKSHTATGF